MPTSLVERPEDFSDLPAELRSVYENPTPEERALLEAADDYHARASEKLAEADAIRREIEEAHRQLDRQLAGKRAAAKRLAKEACDLLERRQNAAKAYNGMWLARAREVGRTIKKERRRQLQQPEPPQQPNG
jgi:predicted unusual protein kinase regulating ubiquinone biosynthesis (AarF/ABC1/UbiB family)